MDNNSDPRAHLALIAMQDDLHSSDALPYHQERQQFQRTSKVGLQPTDGYEAHKRSSARSSRRSRAERTSYLVATGHLDPEETKQLNSSGDDFNYAANISYPPTIDQRNDIEDFTKSYRTNGKFRATESAIITSNRSSDLDQELLVEMRGDVRFHEFKNEEALGQSKMRGGSKKNKDKKLSPCGNQLVSRSGLTYIVDGEDKDNSHNKGRFRQTYTEVSLPMKTSPAFEYILKDNRRRNKRCCMWLLYSTLVTMCLAIIVFSSVHLILRYQNSI